MKRRRITVPPWFIDLFLPGVCLVTLFLKLLVIGHSISPEPFPTHRAPALATLTLVALAALSLTRLPARVRLWAALLLNLSGSALALGDLWHVRFYGDVLSVVEIGAFRQLWLVAPSLSALARPKDVFAILDVVFMTAVRLLTVRDHRRRGYRASVKGVVIGALAVAIVCSAFVLNVVRDDRDDVFEYAFQRREVVGAVGLAGYHLFDLGSYLRYAVRGRIATREQDLADAEQLIASRRHEQLASRLNGVARGRNVIVLSAESLQAFVLGLKVGGRLVAPNLTAFARESMQFTEFYDQTHMGTTADATFIAMNSLMPLSTGAVATRYAANDFRALPAVLGEHGYHSLSAAAEPSSFWNMRLTHQRYGFSRSLFEPDFRPGEWVGVGLADVSFFDQIVPVLRGQQEPFFAYLISSSNHHPYRLPATFRDRFEDPLPGTMAGDYIQSVEYFDAAFGAFIDGLAHEGLLERSVIVLFGDHQSWVDDAELQRLWQLAGNAAPAGLLDMWRFRRKVPLLIRLPRAAEAAPRETPSGLLDIAPTLVSLLGIDGPTLPWLGHDLTSAYRGLVVFRDGSLTDTQTALITKGAHARECHVRDGRDMPCEWLTPLIAEARALLAASDHVVEGNLARMLSKRLATSSSRAPPTSAPFMVIAHRGDSVHYPENTLEAIRSAFALGADAAEVDVRLSSDGVPVIFHDDTLERTTDGVGPFAHRTLRAVKALDAGAWMNRKFRGTRIPTLEEALVVAHGRGRLLLDLKVDGLAIPVAAIYSRLGVDPGEALIGGWTQQQRAEFVRDMPLARILRTEQAPLYWEGSLFRQIRSIGLWGFELGDDWPPSFIGDAALHGVPVLAYTVNDEPTMRRLIEMGVTGIETNDPELLVRVASSLKAR